MSVRVRLFLLLLALTVVPMLLLRLNGRVAMQTLADQLTTNAAGLLVAKAKEQMLLLVQDHAHLWQKEGQLLQQTLRLQARAVEDALAANRNSDLAEAYRNFTPPGDTPLRGQITVLEDGRIVVSSESARMPHSFDGRQTVWYRQALTGQGIIWTAPVIDPGTRRVGITLSTAIRDASGRVVGVTALTAPFSIGGFSREHVRSISERSKTFLVDYDPPDTSGKGFSVIGESDPAPEEPGRPAGQGMMHGMGHGQGMLGLSAPRWLTPDDPIDMSLIRTDLKRGESGVRQAEIDGKDYLWAYAPTGVKNTALVLVAPKSDAAAEAKRASEFIQTSFSEQLHLTLFILLAALLAVVAASWFAARVFTRPIMALAKAWEKVAHGDFSVRVEPGGGGEITALGESFNKMIPHLEEHTRLKQSMALAREVQRLLLPGTLPRVAGLDMAARSIPCEDTGGDSYDVIPRAHGMPGLTAALVGDVSGHGLDAALLMATARALVRMRVRQPGNAAQTVTDVSALLAQDTYGSGRFMTMFYIELDARSRRMVWVRAGHDPAILYRAGEDVFDELHGQGVPLGVLEKLTFTQSEQAWPDPGDVLLIGSDGIWEARGPDGTMFGKQRVREVMRANASLPAAAIMEAVLEELRAFQGDVPSADDVTLLVIKPLKSERTA
ncbi:SpoIIE family protein phosphatase [Fundidesulfovibrio soli]|uniref:SpoIIE family protein phosphatase n=1 Tax=Fundidesulfovibrio soli TaxID=2922716 RepID=UPI001FAF9551|nr:SpoIIE family protein phosphatase [Fundidesulfovibrio soli]